LPLKTDQKVSDLLRFSEPATMLIKPLRAAILVSFEPAQSGLPRNRCLIRRAGTRTVT
jgi:hypothetical protein